MTTFLRAVATMPASLWVVASCGVLAGAMFAQEVKSASAAPPASQSAPAAPELSPAAPETGSGDAPVVGSNGGTPLRFLDSDRRETASAAKPAEAPQSGSGPSVVVIILLIAGAAAFYFMKKGAPKAAAGKRNDNKLELLHSIRVGGRWQVALVRVPGKTLVLGATEKGLSLLTALDLDESIDEDPLDVLAPPRTGISVPAGRPRPEASARAPHQSATPPPREGRAPTTPHPDAFLGKLLDELNGAPSPVRERPLTPSAEALRQRLERFQRKAG